MTDNKNIFTNNKKSDSQNVKDNLLIDELDTVHGINIIANITAAAILSYFLVNTL